MPTQAQIAARKAAPKANGLTPAQAAALAAGADMEIVMAMADDDEADDEAGDEEAAAVAAAAAAASKTEEAPAMTIEAAMAKIAELEAGATEAAAALAGAQAELVTAKAEIEASKAEASALASSLSPYLAKMALNLGQTIDVSALSHTEIVAKHSELKTQFNAAYKPGRQSASAAQAEKTSESKISVDIMAAASNLKL